ncbi:transcriptional regulator [Sphingosinicella rhizophila]|uniref:Transcriptional regulator n=1 Tax=Sphingosinicella rhizophila TaxID=3050082 RepID=A0ABU3QBP4_9SPHN|nr:transcriptional regulator [Sphingosinicella sp. GR2756]MDT9600747.1 transcriptional regulator [Sphingosinicella sp. GR2756]
MSRYSSKTVHRFGDFVLDECEKQLWRGEQRIAISPRYFDALSLLVRNPDTLVTKDRFFAEVWSGLTVGDEALTQCIKTLRQALGDRHRDPDFIVTVPKYGYRFIAPVHAEAGLADSPSASRTSPQAGLSISFGPTLAGTLGGGAAGALGGLVYGLGAVDSGGNAASTLFVLMALTALVGLLGGLGISFGLAGASLVLRREWVFSIVGAALGGFLVGTGFNIIGADSLYLLLGHVPADFTGGIEGAVLGAALAMGARLGGGLAATGWRPALTAGAAGAAAGILISLAGGKLMGGSLGALTAAFDQSRLSFDAIGRLAGEPTFGPVAQMLAAGAEGFLFSLGVVGAILAWHRLRKTQS